MDKIFLRGMKADTLIGVYDWERERPQTLILDLDIGIPEQSFLLLESLAEHIAKLILDNFGALSVRVRIIKPGILPDVKEVGIEIERSKV